MQAVQSYQLFYKEIILHKNDILELDKVNLKRDCNEQGDVGVQWTCLQKSEKRCTDMDNRG